MFENIQLSYRFWHFLGDYNRLSLKLDVRHKLDLEEPEKKEFDDLFLRFPEFSWFSWMGLPYLPRYKDGLRVSTT